MTKNSGYYTDKWNSRCRNREARKNIEGDRFAKPVFNQPGATGGMMCNTLFEGFVKTRKEHICHGCGRLIPIGKRAHRWHGVSEELSTAYHCLRCISAIDELDDDVLKFFAEDGIPKRWMIREVNEFHEFAYKWLKREDNVESGFHPGQFHNDGAYHAMLHHGMIYGETPPSLSKYGVCTGTSCEKRRQCSKYRPIGQYKDSYYYDCRFGVNPIIGCEIRCEYPKSQWEKITEE